MEPGPFYSESLPGSLPRGVYARPTTAPPRRPRTALSLSASTGSNNLSRPNTAPNSRRAATGFMHATAEAAEASDLKNTTGTHAHAFGPEHHAAGSCNAKAYISQNVLKKRINISFAREAYVAASTEA